mgnify:CR=1 FL=1
MSNYYNRTLIKEAKKPLFKKKFEECVEITQKTTSIPLCAPLDDKYIGNLNDHDLWICWLSGGTGSYPRVHFSGKIKEEGNKIVVEGSYRYDKKNNLPLVRTGTIASHPRKDFNGLPQFVIDAQVFPGSSGSPVFIDMTFERFKNNLRKEIIQKLGAML